MNIVAASCIFPSGPSMALAGVALSAKMPLNRKHPFYVDRCGDLVRASYFPEPQTFDVERWIALIKAALQDLYTLQPVTEQREPKITHYSLWLVVPPATRAGVPANLAEKLLAACAESPFTFDRVTTLEGGHAAPVQALHSAKLSLSGATAAEGRAAIVVAVDSWLHPDALDWLETQELLHNASKTYKGQARRNPYGFVPGEAAAAVLLSSVGKSWCSIMGAGATAEPILRTDPRPCTGLGWTQAAQAALATLPNSHKITHIMSDLNGEPYRADQFGFTALRIADRLADNWERYTPVLVTGDVGTATALVHVALSANILRQEDPEQPRQMHLLLSSSDDSLRSALVLG
jgi:3-oxoacyl-[acyl-carrier-protein] synthase I